MAIRTLIIDDERLARVELRKLLKEFSTIEVVDEAANVADALDKIDQLKPDLIFLDIQMPGKTGFDLLAELDRSPQVIFTTAHHEYALKAFEVNALDYLMKPIDPMRLQMPFKKCSNWKPHVLVLLKERLYSMEFSPKTIRFLSRTAIVVGL